MSSHRRCARSVDLPDEVVDLLRDDPGLLAVADAVRSARPSSRYRRPLVAIGVPAMAAAVFVAVLLALVGPWSGHRNPLVAQAAADALKSRVVNLRVATRRPLRLGVDPETGRVIRAAIEIATTFNARTNHGSAVVKPVDGASLPPDGKVAALKAAVEDFPGDYRDAFKMKRAELIGESRSLVWLRITTPNGKRYDVALDRKTLQPLVIRLELQGSKAPVTLDVVGFSTK